MTSRAFSRRRFIGALVVGSIALRTRSGDADALALTPRQTAGPFYPDKLPLDTDNDLVIVTDHSMPALGQITHLSGKILDARGEPIRDALVEIWQVDNHGVYLHSADRHALRDANFQGFGRFRTGSSGDYYFRTIKPVPYPGRTPHIHFAVKIKGQPTFTTQCYVQGEPLNARDDVLNGIRDVAARASVIVPFVPDSRLNALRAQFNIVLGFTPAA
jgi:protocatechuate 3,4-dioxygenase, beta subunit